MDVYNQEITDAELMAELCAGQKGRLEMLMQRYYQPLFRVAWSKLLHRQAAEDVVQETFIAVYGSRESYNSEFSFSTWVWTILLNLCRRELKRQWRQKPIQYVDQNLFANASFPGTITEENGLTLLLLQERRQQIIQSLTQLPEPQADAIRLRFYGELPYEEISRTMNCSLSGAKRRVKTGLIKLADILQTVEEGEV
ncbi:ECF RNA polymerase sigma-E factor [Polystyrenella longa]|uniref:ECF RNA polymerase sigma-E factor n=1 Tax=Polystyrenella longa TaxID=2528007 RepID=A0A518CK29_9PLAN|nr:RNA polymerase sigma factor [Polystyrenella longa]QDU79586.1 ECF RNA polymerase sigma-E factor [Polystyrenella longa]